MSAVHDGRKPHMCDVCDNCYATKSDLKKHIECVHGGKKTKKCQICEKMFFTTSNLKVHFKSAHEYKTCI